MLLKKFNYSEFTDTPNSWSLDGLVLNENVNLLVGKNATGKTNTLTKIFWLGNILAGAQPRWVNSANYDVEFTHNDTVYQYKLDLFLQRVKCEKLTINGEQKFERGKDGTGQIFAAQVKREIDFQLSPNQLVVTSKRDAIQHPFLEELATWAEGQRMYAFGSNMGKNTFSLAKDISNINVDPRNTNSVVDLYNRGETMFQQGFQERIIDSMNDIGYELSSIRVSSAPGSIPLLLNANNTSGFVLYIREKDRDIETLQSDISQGMFRALSLIIQITYNTMSNLSSTILIDDIGEGLDFERSSKLIKLLIELAEKDKNLQLIMSTNDRYVMNKVPFKYWQLIDRIGGKCGVYNYHNSKEIFDEFKYTGLNNFDFLATDFIHAEWESK